MLLSSQVAAVVRHLRSLRQMKSDGGLLQMFLEEAQNERMHLLTFVQMKNPGYFFRAAVIGGQFGFGAAFSLAYLISPAFCHRFVGYVEEEACQTYTKIIHAIEDAPEGSDMAAWRTEAPPKIAISYWKLGEEATVLDLMKAVRADEAEHRDVNHIVSGMKDGESNPFYDPEYKVNLMLSKYVKDIMTRPQKKEMVM
jgi:demethoxyubiquinone hydroxylase (CLK1/Coq7/Cat5 family)